MKNEIAEMKENNGRSIFTNIQRKTSKEQWMIMIKVSLRTIASLNLILIRKRSQRCETGNDVCVG